MKNKLSIKHPIGFKAFICLTTRHLSDKLRPSLNATVLVVALNLISSNGGAAPNGGETPVDLDNSKFRCVDITLSLSRGQSSHSMSLFNEFTYEFISHDPGEALSLLEQLSLDPTQTSEKKPLEFDVFEKYGRVLKMVRIRLDELDTSVITNVEAKKLVATKLSTVLTHLEKVEKNNNVSYMSFLELNRQYLLVKSLFDSAKTLQKDSPLNLLHTWEEKLPAQAFAEEIKKTLSYTDGFFLVVYRVPTRADRLRLLAHRGAYLLVTDKLENYPQTQSIQRSPISLFKRNLALAEQELKQNTAYSNQMSPEAKADWESLASWADSIKDDQTRDIVLDFLESAFRTDVKLYSSLGRAVIPESYSISRFTELMLLALDNYQIKDMSRPYAPLYQSAFFKDVEKTVGHRGYWRKDLVKYVAALTSLQIKSGAISKH